MERPILAAFLSCKETSLTDEEKKIFAKYNPLGITLFGRNISSSEQVKKLCSEIKETVERDDILIAVDQEGGRVRRLQGNGFYDEVSQSRIGALPCNEARQAAVLHSQLICHDLEKVGLNMNFAPVLDLDYEYTTLALKGRCLGSNPQKVADLGKLMVNTYVKNGICPCIKHLPGHGRAKCDPHLGLPIISDDLKTLENDFFPFQKLFDAPAGMTAHILIEKIDDAFPTTLSSKVIQNVIRGIINFKGLLLSDALDMKALKGTFSEKVRAALDAGCEAICYCSGLADELQEVCENCANLADNSLIKFAKIKNILHNKDNVNVSYDTYLNLVGGNETYNYNYDATEVLNQMLLKKQ